MNNIYDYSGNVISQTSYPNCFVESLRNITTGTNYNIVRIFKEKTDGTKQYPFIFAPNGLSAFQYSAIDVSRSFGFDVVINAGVFDINDPSYPIQGTIIQNSQVLQQGSAENLINFYANLSVITIDSNGDLGYAEPMDSTTSMIANGIVSATQSFVPIVINYQDAKEVISKSYLDNTSDTQRQILGQYGNGDYCVITCEARGFQNSTGFTIPQATELCLSLGLKFAFNLDGGGSTETVIGKKQINTIYEGTTGRKVPSFIVFNGTTNFSVPQV